MSLTASKLTRLCRAATDSPKNDLAMTFDGSAAMEAGVDAVLGQSEPPSIFKGPKTGISPL